MHPARLTLIALLCLSAGPALADSDCRGSSEDCATVGRWNFGVSLGAGVRTNPTVDGSAIPLVLIPQVSYYGKRVFLDDLDAGVSLFERNDNTLSLVVSPQYDRVFFYHGDPQNFFVLVPAAATDHQYDVETRPFPRRSRKFSYLGGLEWTSKLAFATTQLDVLQDVTGHSHGTEIRGALAFPLLETVGKLTASAGFTWKSAAVVNYYYGAPGVYAGGPAFNPFVKLGYSLPLSRKWKFSALIHVERLSDSITDSPIVTDRYVETVFVGATYTF